MRLIIKVFWCVACLFIFSSFSVVKAQDEKSIAQIRKRNITHLRTNLQSEIADLKASRQNRKIETRLNNLISRKIKGTDRSDKAAIKSDQVENEKIKVMLKLSHEARDISGQIRNYGARVLMRRVTTAVVEVPINRLEEMVTDVDAINFAGLPPKVFPLGEVSEGVNLSGANILHDNGFKGTGVRVAVIDAGFKGLTEAIKNGDMPDSVITHDYTDNGLETRYYHGTACAEIVYDMVPDAEMYLLKVADGSDIIEAKDFCINNNIDIVSLSLGMFGTGPGDGTGLIDELFDELRVL